MGGKYTGTCLPHNRPDRGSRSSWESHHEVVRQPSAREGSSVRRACNSTRLDAAKFRAARLRGRTTATLREHPDGGTMIRPDWILSDRARRSLLRDEQIASLNVGVTVKDKVATIWGTLPSADVGKRTKRCSRKSTAHSFGRQRVQDRAAGQPRASASCGCGQAGCRRTIPSPASRRRRRLQPRAGKSSPSRLRKCFRPER